jgi:hypothetical protein
MASGPLDLLPLFATDEQIARAVLGIGHEAIWKKYMAVYEREGFPKPDAILNRRYTPAVKAWLDARAGLGEGPKPAMVDGKENLAAWNDRRPHRKRIRDPDYKFAK